MFGLKLVLVALIGTLIASVPLTLERRQTVAVKGDLLSVLNTDRQFGPAKVRHVEEERMTYAVLQPLPEV